MKRTNGMWTERSKHALRAAAVGALLVWMAVPQSWAWGREGHRLTALVAEQYLTPETNAQIVKLLHTETLADVAAWADAYRVDHPETGKWHFVDIPKGEAKFDRDRDCPVSLADPKSPWRDCVTDRIGYFEGRLGDESLSSEERAFALKFVVHLIGDLHQPFHALGNARGGNDIGVTFMGSSQCGAYSCNLHGVWDSMMIKERGLNEKEYTDRLLMEIRDNQWEQLSSGDPAMWANVSHGHAVEALVPNGAPIVSSYVTAASQIVDEQLALGGLRLARELNRILGTSKVAASIPQQR